MGVPEPNLLTVQPWDPKLLASIEKVIRSSDLGLNPMNDGKILRVPVPPLTEERRKELVKHVHKILENHRTALRNIRRDSNENSWRSSNLRARARSAKYSRCDSLAALIGNLETMRQNSLDVSFPSLLHLKGFAYNCFHHYCCASRIF
jgi:hypothetical protein